MPEPAGSGNRASKYKKNGIKITYSDRELSLRLPAPLLWARGTLSPLDDWPGGVSVLAADVLPPAGVADADARFPAAAAGTGDPPPAAGAGDF